MKSLNEKEIGATIKGALKEIEGTLFVHVYLQPSASKTELAGLRGGALKVRVAAPAVENAANEACLSFFAKTFHLPKSHVRLHSGKTSRQKVIALENFTIEQFVKVLQTHAR